MCSLRCWSTSVCLSSVPPTSTLWLRDWMWWENSRAVRGSSLKPRGSSHTLTQQAHAGPQVPCWTHDALMLEKAYLPIKKTWLFFYSGFIWLLHYDSIIYFSSFSVIYVKMHTVPIDSWIHSVTANVVLLLSGERVLEGWGQGFHTESSTRYIWFLLQLLNRLYLTCSFSSACWSDCDGEIWSNV